VTGRAFVNGVEWNGAHWEKSDFLMETRITFAGTTLGMFRNVRENPFSLVAIALLGLLVLTLVPVALFNFTLVRQLARSFMGPVAALREGTRALAASAHAYRIPVSSIKGGTGNPLAAAGPLELIACALAMRDDLIPPTANYTTPDPTCDLDYVPSTAREVPIMHALTNSFGFGGANVCLIFGRP